MSNRPQAENSLRILFLSADEVREKCAPIVGDRLSSEKEKGIANVK